MKTQPKDCSNSSCKNIVYQDANKMYLDKLCEDCQTKHQLTEEQRKEVVLFLELNRYSKSYYNSIKLPQGDFNPYTDRPALRYGYQDSHTIKKALEDIKSIKEA